VIHQFRVRWYQQAFHRALVERTHDKLLAVWHRRAGKDEVLMNAFRDMSRQRIGTYWHCLPEFEQARKALWNGVNPRTGKTRVQTVFPQEAGFKHDQQQMLVWMPWGSSWQLIGSDRYNATVGSGPVAIGYSEWALSNPSAYAYHRPMLRETQGVAAFITTPRGNNHAKTMLDAAKADPSWFWEVLSARDTGTLTEADLEDELRGYQALWGIDMGLAYFEQEYLCSFSGAMIGAYWGAEVNKAEREGRIKTFDIDWNHPVHTAWDLGKAVNNPIWCFQVIAGVPRIVDFYRPDSDDLADWVKWLDDKGYHGTDYVPHDIIVTEWGSKRTRLEILQAMKRKPKRLPMVSVADGLQAGRETINRAWFRDDPGVMLGVEGLRNYRREWDDERKTFRDTPVKDWAEHIGSAFRYLGLAWKDVVPPVPVPKKPDQLIYEVRPDGRVVGNMDVRAAVEAMVRRKKNGR
jgi:phage terminase large subunit